MDESEEELEEEQLEEKPEVDDQSPKDEEDPDYSEKISIQNGGDDQAQIKEDSELHSQVKDELIEASEPLYQKYTDHIVPLEEEFQDQPLGD